MWPFCLFPLSPTPAFRFFTTLTAPGPHLEIHHQTKAGQMKSVAVIYELL